MDTSERNIDSNKYIDSIEHKIIEYNIRGSIDIVDGYTVIINMKEMPLFFGYKKENKWYMDSGELVENPEDIVSFFDMPTPAFFGKRKKR
jgi:hypothetical protein